MSKTDIILIEHICKHHQVEFSFINSLKEMGLLQVLVLEDGEYVQQHQLKDIEKMIRIHFELNINLEGIDAIFHLLNRIENLELELLTVKNKLQAFDIEHDFI